MTRRGRTWALVGGGVAVAALVTIAIVANREEAIEVEVEAIVPRDLTAIVSASGTLEPKQAVSISATISGEVVRVGVEEGQRVGQGDFLLQLDPVNVAAGATGQEAAVRAARADLASSRAQLGYARQEYERKRRLAAAELVPRAELEAAEAELRAREEAVNAAQSRLAQNEASLTSARHDLARVTFTSPIDGIVSRVNVEVGEVAIVGTMNQPGTVLLEIADLSVMEATIDVDETDVVHVELGQPARITIDAFPDTTFAGLVTEVGTSPKIEPTATGPADDITDFEVVVTLEEPLPVARSGLSASADIVTAERDHVLAIPIQSLVVRTVADDTEGGEGIVEREGVFVVRDGVARFVPVRVGVGGDRYFEVLAGLEEGDVVVSGTYQALRDLSDGDRIEVVEGADRVAEAS